MSYKAVILRAHPKKLEGSDKLFVVDLNGYTIVTGSVLMPGELVAYFSSDGGALSHEFCYENSEYREGKGQNKDPAKSGFFDSNRRIKAIKLRGTISEGYIAPLSCLAYTGVDMRTLVDGYEFDELNGHPICEKYYSPQTLREISKQNTAGTPKFRFVCPDFPTHFDTAQLRNVVGKIPLGAVLYWTLKHHGTSGRTTKTILSVPLKKRWQNWWNTICNYFKFLSKYKIEKLEPVLVSGTRNTVLNPFSPYGYSDKYRKTAEDLFHNIEVGETAYYEICGYTDSGGAIQKHSIDKKEFKNLHARYGSCMIYSYGAVASTSKVFVYRITKKIGKETYELSSDQVDIRCCELGVEPVLELHAPTVHTSVEETLALAASLSSGTDPLDTNHIREGVCCRAEHPDLPRGFTIMKLKGQEFCLLEGIARNNESFVDIEEIS